jgi:signal transduction histidine kinase
VLVAVTAGALVLWALAATRPPPPGVMVALYTVAADPAADRRASLRGLAVGAFAALPFLVDDVVASLGVRAPFQLGRFAFVVVLLAASWLAGEALRARRQYLAELEARAERLERERETEAARAVAEEQARIARELHDVIAHNVSVMVVQAGAAEDVFDAQPERARAALRSIDTAGRQALAELRRLLGAVRPEDAALEPQPSLAGLDARAQRLRASGLAVRLSVSGEPQALPAGVELSAYRIVQEALTNALRHARASEVRVALRYAGDALEVQVEDDGVGPAPAAGAPGRGLHGMRERAALTGGVLEAGPGERGGFRVRARLPLESAAA